MKLEITASVVIVTLSKRNLLALLQKVDDPRSSRMLVGGDAYRDGLPADDVQLVVRSSRTELTTRIGLPPGPVHPAAEAFIRGAGRRRGHGLIVCAAELVAGRVLGMPGRMISASKSSYRDQHPAHVAIFNANVCIASGKIWFGDLDLTLDEPQIRELADSLDEQVFVLSEADGRFKHEAEPLLGQALYSVTPGEEPLLHARILPLR